MEFKKARTITTLATTSTQKSYFYFHKEILTMYIKFTFIAFIISTVLISGCASTSGSHQIVGTPMSSSQAAKYSDLQVTVQPNSGISLSQIDTERMSKLIAENIKTENPSRFNTINAATLGPKTLKASVMIKNYEEGNAFGRFMLAGVGQIHIDANVILSEATSNEKLAQHEVNKTFAWGGIYGATTNIKDVEVGFCKAVAESILGKE